MVVVSVGQHDRVECADATCRQPSHQHLGIGSSVDDHARATASPGRLDEQPITLADVEHRELQRGRCRRRQPQEHDGHGHRHRSDAGHGRAGQAQRDPEQRWAQENDQVPGPQRRQPDEGGRRPPHDTDRQPRQPCHRHGARHLQCREPRGDQAERLGDRGSGAGHQVRGQRRERHRPRERQQYGRGRDLRADRRGQHDRQRPGCAGPLQRGHHSRGRQNRQREPDLACQQWIDQQQHHHRHRERVHRVARTTAQHAHQPDGGHGSGAQNRRLPACQHDEPPHGHQRQTAAAAYPQATRRRQHHQPRQQHRDVPTGYDDQVRQTGGGQFIGRQPVAGSDHHPAEQGGMRRRQRRVEHAQRARTEGGGDRHQRRRGTDLEGTDRIRGRHHTRVAQITPERAVRQTRDARHRHHGLAHGKMLLVGSQQHPSRRTVTRDRRHTHDRPAPERRGTWLGDHASADLQRVAVAGRTRDR